MIDQQLQDIEDRWNSNVVTLQTINDFNLLLAEVRRLNRMVDIAVEVCGKQGDNGKYRPCSDKVMGICSDDADCIDCWRKYLESEVADNG